MNMTVNIEAKQKKAPLITPASGLSQDQLLWRAVLAQSVRDIYGGETKPRLEVIRWLKTKDFDTVCDCADVEVTSMREQLAALLALPAPLARKYGKLLRDKIMSGIHSET